jgi:phosphoenolpyruvate carboxykinase (ATP)
VAIEKRLESLFKQLENRVIWNPSRASMIEDSVAQKEAMVSSCGALVGWTPVDSTGRSPKDTMLVRRKNSEKNIDWDAPNNIAMDPETFEMLLEDSLKELSRKSKLYVVDRVVGADSSYALPIRTVTDKALSALFVDNMFRPVPKDIKKSIFSEKGFTLLSLPYDKLDPKRYEGRLRVDPRLGHTSTMAIAMDMDQRIGIVFGSRYCGSLKKLVFTVMNYLLP